MPLVRTPMIAPTKIYDRFPTLSPEEAAEMICDAIRKRPKRVATALGNLGQLTYAIAPGAQDLVVNRAYKLFPEGGGEKPSQSPRSRRPNRRRSSARSPGRRAECTGSTRFGRRTGHGGAPGMLRDAPRVRWLGSPGFTPRDT